MKERVGPGTASPCRALWERAGGGAAVLAAAAAVPHVVEDLDAGIGVETLGRIGATALAVLLVGLLGVLGLLVVLTRRRPVRTLIAVDLFWAIAAVVDHPQALIDAGGFREGFSSAAPSCCWSCSPRCPPDC